MPDAVKWFHATRVRDPSVFLREGILPKSCVLGQLEALLRDLATGLQRHGDYPNSFSVTAKGAVSDEGPFAFLFRSVATCPQGATHPYASSPESVEDIAGAILGADYIQLVERFQAITKPCVVTFWSAGEPHHVAHALHYLLLVEQGVDVREAAEAATTCYSGEGRPVSPESIVSVEELTDGSSQRFSAKRAH